MDRMDYENFLHRFGGPIWPQTAKTENQMTQKTVLNEPEAPSRRPVAVQGRGLPNQDVWAVVSLIGDDLDTGLLDLIESKVRRAWESWLYARKCAREVSEFGGM